MSDFIPQVVGQLAWLGYAWVCITTISRWRMQRGSAFATWVAASALYGLLVATLFQRTYYPDFGIILFLGSGLIAANAIRTEVHNAITRLSRAVLVVSTGAMMAVIFGLSVYGWTQNGAWICKAWAAIGLVAMACTPFTVAWNTVMKELFA